jgi:hypothetical protein
MSIFRSVLFGVLGGLLFLGMLYWIKGHFAFGNRFASMLEVSILTASIVPIQILAAEAFYLRCHKQEPFMILSIANGLLMAFSVLILVPRFGVLGACISYCFVNFLMVPFGTRIFFKKRRQWMTSPPFEKAELAKT